MIRRTLFILFSFSSLIWSFDITDYGLVLGGAYSQVSGSSANDMGLYVNHLEFVENIKPFRTGVDAKADPSGALGPVVGAFIRFSFNEWLYVRTDLNYLWKGAEYHKKLDTLDTYGGREALDIIYGIAQTSNQTDQVIPGSRRIEYNNAYLELPILFGVNIIQSLSVYAGMQVAYLLHSSFDFYVTEGRFVHEGRAMSFGKKNFSDFKLSTHALDFGYTLGANFIMSDQLQLGVRWSPSLKDFLDMDGSPEIKNNTIQLLLSLNFNPY